MNDNQTALMLEIAAGSKASFDELIKTYLKEVFDVAYRMYFDEKLAAVITGSVFKKAWKYARLWQASSHTDIKIWLYKLTLKSCGRQDKQRVANLIGTMQLKLQDLDVKQEEALHNKHKLIESMKIELLSLPKKQRLAVILSIFIGMSNQEIARVIEENRRKTDLILGTARLHLLENFEKLKGRYLG